MRKNGRRRRVGKVVRRYVNGLNGGDSESAVAKSLQRAKDMLASISSDAANSAAIMARVDEFARQS